MQSEPLSFMGHARDRHRAGPIAGNGGLHLLFPAGERSVRRALSASVAAFHDMGVDRDGCDFAELVLAEVLNNVVEHAFTDRGHGIIELRRGARATPCRCGYATTACRCPGNASPPPSATI